MDVDDAIIYLFPRVSVIHFLRKLKFVSCGQISLMSDPGVL